MARIMVVDDDPVARDVCAGLLTQAGHDVEPASSGHEAIELYRQRPFDLVFMDVLMPRLDGAETTVSLLNEFPDARIVAMSGGFLRHKDFFLEEAKRYGAVAAIGKPFTGEELLAVVEGTLAS